jgi:putative nucleotidyltransferase with HDIG domain
MVSAVELASGLLILVGALILILSLAMGVRLLRLVPGELRPKWLAALFLMGFFIAGYFFSLAAILLKAEMPLHVVMGVVFFAGACFVAVMVVLSRSTVLKVTAKEREAHAYMEELSERTRALEKEGEGRRKAEERARMRLQKLSALHAIDLMIGASLDLRVTLNEFLEQSVSQLGVDAACVLTLDAATQTLRYAAGLGFRTRLIEESRVRLGDGAAGRAALRQEKVVIGSLEEKPQALNRAGLVRAEGFASYCGVPMVAKGRVTGVLELFHRSPLEMGTEWLSFLDALALDAAIAVENATLFKELQRSNTELVLAYDSTLEGWSRALELRDRETEGHTQRVVDLTLKMARSMGVREEDMVHVRRGALLHDIGKMSIPDDILFKEGPLTEEEREVMRRHPSYAFELLYPIAYLRPALDIPYSHHEKWDGTGYPRGLKGERIPLAARIFSVVDTWDALLYERRYHAPWPPERACRHIESLAGTDFDPQVVGVFLDMQCKGAARGGPSPHGEPEPQG